MNELTRQLVIQTARRNPKEAIENGIAFLSKLQIAHNAHVSFDLLIPLRKRATALWKQFHPEHFDEEGFLDNWEIEEALSKRINRIAERICERSNSPHNLSGYGDFPKQIASPLVPNDVEKFYMPELDWCIKKMVINRNITEDSLKKRLAEIYSPIPPTAAKMIATHAVDIRRHNQTIGLPLFEI